MFENKTVSIITLIIAILALSLSIINTVRINSIHEIKKVLVEMEFQLETRNYLSTALADLKEALNMVKAHKDWKVIRKKINNSAQLLGIARVTAKSSDRQKISLLRKNLNQISVSRRTARQPLKESLENLSNQIKLLLDRP